MLQPTLPWQRPEEMLTNVLKAFAIVDCKSLYDLLQKTSIPQYSEYRTMLEALIIKDRLTKGVVVKWVHSAAQLADAPTKDMDTTPLRIFLDTGTCRVHDIETILQQRADKKVRNQWIAQTASNATASNAS